MGFLGDSSGKEFTCQCRRCRQKMWLQSPSQQDPLEEETAAPCSPDGWEIPWMEAPGRLESTGSQRVGHNRVTELIRMLKVRWGTSRSVLKAYCEIFRTFSLFSPDIILKTQKTLESRNHCCNMSGSPSGWMEGHPVDTWFSCNTSKKWNPIMCRHGEFVVVHNNIKNDYWAISGHWKGKVIWPDLERLFH